MRLKIKCKKCGKVLGYMGEKDIMETQTGGAQIHKCRGLCCYKE